MKKSERKQADLFFHRLWTAAVGAPGYDKRGWTLIQRAIWSSPKEDTEGKAGVSFSTKGE